MPLFGRKKKEAQPDHRPVPRPENDAHRIEILEKLAKDHAHGKFSSNEEYLQLHDRVKNQMTGHEIKVVTQQISVGVSVVAALATAVGTMASVSSAMDQPATNETYSLGRFEQTRQDQIDADNKTNDEHACGEDNDAQEDGDGDGGEA